MENAESDARPTRSWRRFLHGHKARMVAGLMVLACLYGMMSIAIPHFREQRIAKQIEAIGGKVFFDDRISQWLFSNSTGLKVLERITGVELDEAETVLSPELIAELKSLNCLTLLVLNGAQVIDANPRQLAGLNELMANNRLVNLWLRGSQVNDATLEGLQFPTGLKELHLYGARITDAGMEHVRGLNRLEWLDLRFAPITGDGLKYLQNLDRLRILDLSGSELTDEGLRHVTRLRNLDFLCLSSTNVSDDGIECLKVMTKLGTITFHNQTKTTEEGRSKLQQALPQCAIDPIPAY